MSSEREYVLGADAEEVARLDAQAASIAQPTAGLLQAAGIEPGMRVLDLGTGPGHVAFMVAGMVGDSGQVLGVDTSSELLALAEQRRAAAGLANVEFAAGDARSYRASEPLDAIVTRLLLFHLVDAAAVVRHHVAALRPGGLMVAIDFDLGGARVEPPLELAATALAWCEAAFRRAGADPRIGARLAALLGGAGLHDVGTFGVQGYLAAADPLGPALLAGIVRSLAPAIVAGGIATAEEIGVDTLEQRLTDALAASGSVAFLPPTVVGAWGRR